ncbi:MAG: polysaccharide deacetylase family protein, partial [Actinomycetota bacterium]|nr:polysaccharide deacetylase family protein [Actinomycetota bacterium]
KLPATFFLVGSMLQRRGGRELAERAAAEGHWVGNHSMTHTTPLGAGLEPDEARREIEETQALLGDLSHERRFFRPFGGGGIIGQHLLSPAAVDLLCDDAYTCVLWNSVPRDWEDPRGWVDAALADVDRLEHAVIVLHDLPTGAMDVLPNFLDVLQAKDTVFVQDFPTDVVAIERGTIRMLDGLVAQ